MKYDHIIDKAKRYHELAKEVNAVALAKWEGSFELEYTHESTAIEGNTLSLMETKVVLEDGISVGGKHLREIFEVVNHKKAYDFIKVRIADKEPLTEAVVKDIHSILMENIFAGGFYRNVNVRITGAAHIPPDPDKAYRQMKNFSADLSVTRMIPLRWQLGHMLNL